MSDKINRKPKAKSVPIRIENPADTVRRGERGFSTGFMKWSVAQPVCGWCGFAADNLCDAIVGKRTKTCDNHICEQCSIHLTGKHFGLHLCPDHKELEGRDSLKVGDLPKTHEPGTQGELFNDI